MMTDLGYAFRQVRFARACNGRFNTLAVDDALSRALDALERIREALERPVQEVQVDDADWLAFIDDTAPTVIVDDADGFTDAELLMLARMGSD